MRAFAMAWASAWALPWAMAWGMGVGAGRWRSAWSVGVGVGVDLYHCPDQFRAEGCEALSLFLKQCESSVKLSCFFAVYVESLNPCKCKQKSHWHHQNFLKFFQNFELT